MNRVCKLSTYTNYLKMSSQCYNLTLLQADKFHHPCKVEIIFSKFAKYSQSFEKKKDNLISKHHSKITYKAQLYFAKHSPQ